MLSNNLDISIDRASTADQVILEELSFAVTFTINDVLLMIENTADPVTDFMNVFSSDVIQYVSTQTLAQLKQNTQKLSRVETFLSTQTRAKGLG
jgi:hypothetical protein